jgi:hypothetical protein
MSKGVGQDGDASTGRSRPVQKAPGYRCKLGDTFTQHLLSVAVDYQEGVFSGAHSFIAELTGTPPMTVQAFIRKHTALFA